MKLWIDDIRPIPTDMFVDFDLHFYSVDETIEYLKSHLSEVDFISLDHDAGDYFSCGGDYIKILDWIEKEEIDSIAFHIHSGNPVGIRNMEKIIDKNGWKYYDFRYDDCYEKQ